SSRPFSASSLLREPHRRRPPAGRGAVSVTCAPAEHTTARANCMQKISGIQKISGVRGDRTRRQPRLTLSRPTITFTPRPSPGPRGRHLSARSPPHRPLTPWEGLPVSAALFGHLFQDSRFAANLLAVLGIIVPPALAPALLPS